MSIWSSRIGLAVGLVAALAVACPSAALAITIGGTEYAVLSIGGDATTSSSLKIYQSGTVIDGNVGEGPFTLVTHGIDATINGTWYFDTATDKCGSLPCASTATPVVVTGTVTGGFVAQNMAPVVAAARSAATTYAGLAPTQTFATLTEGQIITVGHGATVIRVTGASTIKTSLTINGFADSVVVFQLTASATPGHDILTLSGMTMNLGGGVTAGNIIWDAIGTGGDIDISSMALDQIVYGTFLVPDRNFTGDHANILGEVIAGGSGTLLEIHSTSHITAPSVPEPSALVLLGTGMSALGVWIRRSRRTEDSAKA